MSAVGLAIGALAAGSAMQAGAGIANTIGSRKDIKNAPDKLRSRGNFAEALGTDNLIPYIMTYQINDFDKVADTYEKTGYRVDKQSNAILQTLQDFYNSNALGCREYFAPVQVSSVEISFTRCVPDEVRDDIQARLLNGIRFYPYYNCDPKGEFTEYLRFDNVEW